MSLGKSNLWVFFLGSGPVFVVFGFLLFASLFPLAKRKSGWGICGSSCLVVFCGFCVLYYSICLLKMDMLCPCTNVFPTAYAHVRTEPLARHRPNSRKKIWSSAQAINQQMRALQSIVFDASELTLVASSTHWYRLASVQFF